jgi:hypothetical protein
MLSRRLCRIWPFAASPFCDRSAAKGTARLFGNPHRSIVAAFSAIRTRVSTTGSTLLNTDPVKIDVSCPVAEPVLNLYPASKATHRNGRKLSFDFFTGILYSKCKGNQPRRLLGPDSKPNGRF